MNVWGNLDSNCWGLISEYVNCIFNNGNYRANYDEPLAFLCSNAKKFAREIPSFSPSEVEEKWDR